MQPKFTERYKKYWSHRDFAFSSLIGLLLLVLSLTANHFASLYATREASSAVTDLLLDNLPVMQVEWIVNDAAALFGFFMAFLLLWQPRRLPFALKSTALFVSIRALFMIFTHLAPFPERLVLDPNDFFGALTTGGDYFFSGHTGLPFLFALIYWQEKSVRYACLTASLILGTGVILAHLHYSIDVFAAYFITYGIFVLTQRLFAKDYFVFSEKGLPPEATLPRRF
ncbi:MAG: phosphatase PAP2-related protein [Candidatus Moraniibacteriota bacterium]